MNKLLQGVKDALQGTKPGKAAGVDEVCPELLTADMEDTTIRLTSCYNRLWETDRWSKVWSKELVKLFSSLRECNNWRGVTLLPVISKIFCRMQLSVSRKSSTKNFQRSRLGFDPREVQLNRPLYLQNILSRQMSGKRVCMRTL